MQGERRKPIPEDTGDIHFRARISIRQMLVFPIQQKSENGREAPVGIVCAMIVAIDWVWLEAIDSPVFGDHHLGLFDCLDDEVSGDLNDYRVHSNRWSRSVLSRSQ
jgi:hypothetical protein